MTRKDYKLIAEAIKIALDSIGCGDSQEEFNVWHSAIGSVAHGIAMSFAEDNPRFDQERFLDACGITSPR